MSEELTPLPVLGYTNQNRTNIDCVNENKQTEERILREIDRMLSCEVVDGESNEDYGYYALRVARTRMIEAFMWLNRGLFNPQRIKLPEDEA